ADIYRTYDDDTLEALAEGGDLMAIKVLAHQMTGVSPDQETEGLDLEEKRQYRKERGQKKKKYLELAMVYGDTELAIYASRLHEDDWTPRRSSQAEIRSSLLKKLAFWEF